MSTATRSWIGLLAMAHDDRAGGASTRSASGHVLLSMRSNACARFLWTLLLPLLGVCARAAVPDESVYIGEARDQKGVLVYTEKHRVHSAEGTTKGSVTEYTAPDGSLIATLRADYARSVALPTYVFEDLQRKYREGLRWQEGGYVIFHQQGSAPEKTAPLRSESGVFSCQGWHYHLINNLSLLEKDNIALNLVLPSELRPYSFVVKRRASDDSRISAELSLKNWLFRQFAPEMRLEYDRENRRLLEFHGVSNILTKAGDRQEVTIRYRYARD